MMKNLLLLLFALVFCVREAQAQPVTTTQCVTTAVAGGTSDAITIPTLPCVPTTTLLLLTISHANTTNTPTIAAPSGPILPVVTNTGGPLSPGFLTPGMRTMLSSNGANWFLLNTSTPAGACAPSSPGLVPPTGGGTAGVLRADCTFTNSVVAGQNSAITTVGAAFIGATSNSASADLIESYVFCTAPGSATSCGGGNFDGLQGIGISNSGTTTNLVTGVSGYVVSNQPFSGSGPFADALFGAGAVNVDGGRIEGFNVNVSDRIYRVAQPHGAHNRIVNGGEIDSSVSYDDTILTALLIGGNSVLQPLDSTAVAVVGQDFSAPGGPGSIAKWTQAYYTYPGVAIHFANVGPVSNSTVNTDSQDFIFPIWVANASFSGQFYFGVAHSPNFGSTTQPSFNMNYPLQIHSGGMTVRATTDQVLQFGGNLDLTSGMSIESRSDAGAPVRPLEILSSNIFLNSNMLQVNNGSGITTAANCLGSPTGAFATINGIVTHC